jgi:hypothetical protein
MAAEGPIDLIRLEGEGNSVIVRITGKDPGSAPDTHTLVGEILVDTAFVRGSIATWVAGEDISRWQDALDTLDTGEDVAWRMDGRATGISVELDPDDERAHVTVADRSMSLTTVTVTVVVTDAWFDDAYRRLDQVVHAWPMSSV